MSKSFALAAFNTAVIATNAAHAAKRGVVAAASFTKDNAVAGTTATKEAGVAFWAGMKYAHNYNKANAGAAERLTPEDFEASKPSKKSAKSRTVSKSKAAARSAK